MASTLSLKAWMVWASVVIICRVSVEAEVQHVVGEDRGWASDTDVASWSSDKTFRVGDKIWFAYSPAHGMIAELKTEEEYESCNVNNPIKIYADGLDSILLDGEGIRYFVSSNIGSCKNGLKLPVKVIPKDARDDHALKISITEGSALAAAGPTPSVSVHLDVSFIILVVGFWLSYMLI